MAENKNMTTYISNKGNKYLVSEHSIAKGGEGEIYLIPSNPMMVAKIFFPEKRTKSRELKLYAMINSNLPESALKQIAWPVELLYLNNQFCGYIMPKLKSSVDLNRVYQANGDYSYLNFLDRIIIAQNLCRAVEQIHLRGQVIGDLNPANIQVTVEGRYMNGITLVDTDSYHIKDYKNNLIYKCLVANPLYTAPELQLRMGKGKTYSSLKLPTFTQQTDLFSLAVLLFALLMNGSHPFARKVKSTDHYNGVVPDINKEIGNRNSVYFKPSTIFDIPLYSPGLEILSPKLQLLFKKSLVMNPEDRATPREWIIALMEYRNTLRRCSHKSEHIYAHSNHSCPWCQLERDLGLPFFEKKKVKILEKHFKNETNVSTGVALQNKSNSKNFLNSPRYTDSKQSELKTKALITENNVSYNLKNTESSFKPVGPFYFVFSLIVAAFLGFSIGDFIFGDYLLYFNSTYLSMWGVTAIIAIFINFLFTSISYNFIRSKIIWFFVGELITLIFTLLLLIFVF